MKYPDHPPEPSPTYLYEDAQPVEYKDPLIARIGGIAVLLLTLAVTGAEFVEDQATALRLQSIGVDFVQGYHIGKPVPLAHINLIRFCDSQYSEKAVA